MKKPIPPSSLLIPAMPAGAWQHSCRLPLPVGEHSIDCVVDAFFAASPPWLKALVALRDKLVGPFGLRRMAGAASGVFRPIARSRREVVLGEDDSHLDFRTSLLILAEPDGKHLVVSTWVRPHNALGRGYLALVGPLHRMIAPVIARAIVRRLAAGARDA
ncbi:DUF2867 domain-containing protein [Zoogloea sp.]|uniref:DUF2867 domain-containing protein n=1 Tax=Zoogloea sp. TaxID=49181 RepID=UPI002639F07A|nr:DUF2867 domain-containing protein [Zoogloea sp.]